MPQQVSSRFYLICVDGYPLISAHTHPLCRPSRIPVLYVFSKAPLDIKHAAESLLNLAFQEISSQASTDSPQFILIPDVTYVHLAG